MYLKILFGGKYVKATDVITKNDLVQAKLYKDIILNVEDKTKFDAKKNDWIPFDSVE